MLRKLIQYGGYLISGVLIAWLINPKVAQSFLEVFLKMTILIAIPVTGAYSLDKVILLKHKKAWNITISIWIVFSICFSFWLVKFIETYINY
mgnify:CR=1 FL=1|tara:strand:- start:157 stop:432 length:276 start_codon:yes stop_codon:yes gene_type:complete